MVAKITKITVALVIAIALLLVGTSCAWQSESPKTVTANPAVSDNQSALEQPELLQVTIDSPEVLIAILDTGIDEQHKDLAGKVVASINFSNSPTTSDINGHGTHVAGIIAATVNKGNGVAGVTPEVRFLNVKVADDKGLVWSSAVAEGIVWAVDNGAKIINISLYVTTNKPALEQAVEYAWSKGVVLVAASGNHVKSAVYPGYYPEVISVAAIDAEGDLWSGSNDGDWVDAYAPGVKIKSTIPGNRYGYKTGTSMAAAYVSATAALDLATVTDANSDGQVNDEVVTLLKTDFANPKVGSVAAATSGVLSNSN